MRASPPLALPAIRAAKMELLSPPFAHARSCPADRLHGCSGGCGRGPSAGGTSLVPRLSTCSRARPVAGSSSDGGASFRRASGMRLGGVLCCTLQGPARALRASLHSAARFVSRACCGALGHVRDMEGGGVFGPSRFACVCVCTAVVQLCERDKLIASTDYCVGCVMRRSNRAYLFVDIICLQCSHKLLRHIMTCLARDAWRSQ